MVNNEQNNRTYRCNEDAAEIEGFNLSQTDETAMEAAQDATGYADENRDKKTSGIAPVAGRISTLTVTIPLWWPRRSTSR